MTHIVNSLDIAIACPSEQHALDVRDMVARTVHAHLVADMERACTRMVPSNELLRIERLEIDLGDISLNAFDTDFASAFSKAFDRTLADAIARLSQSARSTSRAQSRLELLRFYLLKGSLPWWADEPTFELDEVARAVLAEQSDDLRSFLVGQAANAAMWRRVAWQLEPTVTRALIAIVSELDASATFLESWASQLAADGSAPIDERAIADVIEELVLGNAAEIIGGSIDAAQLLPLLRSRLRAHGVEREQINRDRSVIEELITEPSAVDQEVVPPGVQRDTRPTTSDPASPLNIVTPVLSESGAGDADRSGRRSEEIEQAQIDESPLSLQHTEVAIDVVGIDDEKFVVHFAGVVLLAPFLKPLFSQLGLLDGSTWRDQHAQYRAVHLLRYLSSGEHHASEYLLTLEKIVCGLEYDEPIPKQIELTDVETFECERVLQSVIEHWSALRNTSIGGLQQTFLKREGILVRASSGWILRVERTTVDVLLESLPWGFSMLVFPWNNHMLSVEW